MSILKVKVNLDAYYDNTGSAWMLTSNNERHLKVGDNLTVSSKANWDNAPKTLKITEVKGSMFKTDQVPQVNTQPPAKSDDIEVAPTSISLEKTIPLKDPQTLQWDMVDLEAENCSGRNQLGEYFRDVFAKKISLSVSWGLLNNNEIADILQSIENDSFDLEYPDAKSGERKTLKAYVNSRTTPMYSYQEGAGVVQDEWMWQGLSVNFMEV